MKPPGQKAMPGRNVHRKLDDKLKKRGVIRDDTPTDFVHDTMDGGVTKFGGWQHQENDPKHTITGIREVLANSKKITSERTKTDCIRVAHGHRVLDRLAKKGYDDEDELVERAYRVLVAKRHDKARFKKRHSPGTPPPPETGLLSAVASLLSGILGLFGRGRRR